MSRKKSNVFISYSRKDKDLIEPVVNLIKAMRDNLVFQDIQSLQFGEKWEPQLMDAIKESEITAVFWCDHSLKSVNVQNEYEYAIALNKKVLPIRLDWTPFPENLAQYHAVDFAAWGIHEGGGIHGYYVNESRYQNMADKILIDLIKLENG
jgi:hypothetical protein